MHPKHLHRNGSPQDGNGIMALRVNIIREEGTVPEDGIAESVVMFFGGVFV
jgi:hypothetical protein